MAQMSERRCGYFVGGFGSGKAPRGRKAKKAGHVPGVGDVK
jgi:hypothetical protein